MDQLGRSFQPAGDREGSCDAPLHQLVHLPAESGRHRLIIHPLGQELLLPAEQRDQDVVERCRGVHALGAPIRNPLQRRSEVGERRGEDRSVLVRLNSTKPNFLAVFESISVYTGAKNNG